MAAVLALVVAAVAMIGLSSRMAEGQARGSTTERATPERTSAEPAARPRPELMRRATQPATATVVPSSTARIPPAEFDAAHARFHQELDRRCRARAEQRPLDLRWQVRVRAECRIEHDAWHERHDPTWGADRRQ